MLKKKLKKTAKTTTPCASLVELARYGSHTHLLQDMHMKPIDLKLLSLSAVITLTACSFGVSAEEHKQPIPKNMNIDQIEGRVGEAQGKAKEETGKILDDKGMEIEGNVQKNLGKTQKGLGDIKKDIKEDK